MRDRMAGGSASFRELLDSLGQAHDREIAVLRAELERAQGHAPSSSALPPRPHSASEVVNYVPEGLSESSAEIEVVQAKHAAAEESANAKSMRRAHSDGEITEMLAEIAQVHGGDSSHQAEGVVRAQLPSNDGEVHPTRSAGGTTCWSGIVPSPPRTAIRRHTAKAMQRVDSGESGPKPNHQENKRGSAGLLHIPPPIPGNTARRVSFVGMSPPDAGGEIPCHRECSTTSADSSVRKWNSQRRVSWSVPNWQASEESTECDTAEAASDIESISSDDGRGCKSSQRHKVPRDASHMKKCPSLANPEDLLIPGELEHSSYSSSSHLCRGLAAPASSGSSAEYWREPGKTPSRQKKKRCVTPDTSQEGGKRHPKHRKSQDGLMVLLEEMDRRRRSTLNLTQHRGSLAKRKTVTNAELPDATPWIKLNDLWQQAAEEYEDLGSPRKSTTLHKSESSFSFRPLVSHSKSTRKTRSGFSFSMLMQQPSSSVRLVWDICSIACLCYDLVVIPLQVFDIEDDIMLVVGRHVTAIFWTIDIFASFCVGYHEEGTLIMDPLKVAIHYIKSWFMLDLALVVVEWVILAFGFSSKASAVRLGKVTRGMRALRLLRLIRLNVLVSDCSLLVRSEQGRTILYVFKLITFIVAINHFLACGFYGLDLVLENDNAWIDKNFAEDSAPTYRYWTSMHWSLTQFTPASMEVYPVNTVERIYTVCVLLFALVTFSSFVSSITTAMTHLRTINSQKRKEEQCLRRYLEEHHISAALNSRVLHYVQDRTQENRRTARTKEEDTDLFKVLPESMKHELRCEHYLPLVKKHPMFFQYSHCEFNPVEEICSHAITEKRLILHDELFGRGVTVTHMVFNIDGIMGYSYPCQGRSVDARILKGQWVCEVALWVDRVQMYGPLIAESNCEVAMLDAGMFRSIAQMHPESLGVVATYGNYFVEEVGRNMVACRWEVVLHNELDEMKALVERSFRGEENISAMSSKESDVTKSMRQNRPFMNVLLEAIGRVNNGTAEGQADRAGAGDTLIVLKLGDTNDRQTSEKDQQLRFAPSTSASTNVSDMSFASDQ